MVTFEFDSGLVFTSVRCLLPGYARVFRHEYAAFRLRVFRNNFLKNGK